MPVPQIRPGNRNIWGDFPAISPSFRFREVVPFDLGTTTAFQARCRAPEAGKHVKILKTQQLGVTIPDDFILKCHEKDINFM